MWTFRPGARAQTGRVKAPLNPGDLDPRPLLRHHQTIRSESIPSHLSHPSGAPPETGYRTPLARSFVAPSDCSVPGSCGHNEHSGRLLSGGSPAAAGRESQGAGALAGGARGQGGGILLQCALVSGMVLRMSAVWFGIPWSWGRALGLDRPKPPAWPPWGWRTISLAALSPGRIPLAEGAGGCRGVCVCVACVSARTIRSWCIARFRRPGALRAGNSRRCWQRRMQR